MGSRHRGAMPSSALTNALALMSAQDGLAHVAQLRALGVSKAEVSSRLASGSWRRERPGVLAVAGAPVTQAMALRAAYLALRFPQRGAGERDVAVTGSSAAGLYSWPLPPGFVPVAPRLIVPARVTPRAAPAVRVGDWAHRRFAEVAGLRTAIPADALLDLAGEISRDDVFALVQAEVHRRPATARRLRTRCRSGAEGSASIRSVLDALDQGIDSVLHEHGHSHLRVVRLPKPRCGVELFSGMGSCDCVIDRPGATAPPWGLVVGWDGATHRLEKRKYRHDQLRDRQARREGWKYAHYGWDDHLHPDDMYGDLTERWGRVLRGTW